MHDIGFSILPMLKCVVPWHQVHSHGSAVITTVHVQNFFIFPKRNSLSVKHFKNSLQVLEVRFNRSLSFWALLTAWESKQVASGQLWPQQVGGASYCKALRSTLPTNTPSGLEVGAGEFTSECCNDGKK